MRRIKTLIIDDEPDSLALLQEMTSTYCPQLEVMALVSDPAEAVRAFEEHQPQLLLLDIQMPQVSGFELLKQLEGKDFKVVFITGYDQYAIKAIKCAALDYLLKPVDRSELLQAIQRVEESLQKQDIRVDFLTKNPTSAPSNVILPSGKGYRVVSLHEIVSLHGSAGNYVLFKLTDGVELLVSTPLSHYEEMLPDSVFFRVHKSHMVHMEKVVSYDKGEGGFLTLSDGSKLEIAQRRKSEFVQRLKARAFNF